MLIRVASPIRSQPEADEVQPDYLQVGRYGMEVGKAGPSLYHTLLGQRRHTLAKRNTSLRSPLGLCHSFVY